MRVTPDAPVEATNIALRNIHSADKSHLSVNDGKFPMVAVIDFARKTGKTDFQETLHLNAFKKHLLKKCMIYLPATYVIIKHTYFYAFPRLVNKCITQQTADRIILKNIELNVNMLLRMRDLPQQPFQLIAACC